jgi:hypothetical protein
MPHFHRSMTEHNRINDHEYLFTNPFVLIQDDDFLASYPKMDYYEDLTEVKTLI